MSGGLAEPRSEPTSEFVPAVRLRRAYLFADSQLLFWRGHGVPVLHDAVTELAPRNARAAYVGVSNGDRPEFFSIFEGAMDLVGVRNRRMVRSAYADEDRAYLLHADIILLAGGDVAAGLRVMAETHMAGDIIDRYHAGATLIGVSAGAVQLGLTAWGREAPGGDDDEVLDALGVVPYMVDVHDEGNEWGRLRRLVSRAGSVVRGLGLPTGGGAIHHADSTLEPVRHVVTECWVSPAGPMEALLWPPAPVST